MYEEYEVPKYKKATNSNISKAKCKSKHKHHYEECLVQYRYKFLEKNCLQTSLKSYCTICGKLNSRLENTIVKDYVKTIDSPVGKLYSLLNDKELYDEYHDKMPVFHTDDIFTTKYIDLNQINTEKDE